MADATLQKKRCEFWDKCYRKNKKHKEEFLHPEDLKNEDAVAATKPRLVHDISNATDDDITPAWKNGKKRILADDADGKDSGDSKDKASIAVTSLTSPPSLPKKVKINNDDEEKITVSYNKNKKTAKDTNSSEASTSKSITDLADENDDKGSKTETQKTIFYKGKKEKCKYWDKCYQTSEAHINEYLHPGEETEEIKEQSASSKNLIEDDGTVQFESGYTLKRDGDVYSCTCKGFLIQKAPINERTCKHLKEYLGEEFEKSRVEKNKKPRKPHCASHIQVSLLLAQKYDDKTHNPVGWWISEKLDGVRAFWNGKCFYSRLGNAFYAPDWFTKDLPKDLHLDGELFGGRGQFQSTVSIVKTAESPKWKDIKYYVFDAPHMETTPFEERMYKIKYHFEEHQPEYAVFVEQTKCSSKEQLEQKLTKVLNLGGEGLMIRQPKSKYEASRSYTLLKIKKFYDAEAVVIGHEKGKGSNLFRCGALRCRMACGKEFSVGSGLTNKDRNHPPKIGSIITYKFQELSKSGSPRFPTYIGIRIDMTEPKDAEIRPVLDDDEA